MSVDFTEDQKRRLINLYKINNANDIKYEDVLNKYILFLETYLSSSPQEFMNPDYLYSFNGGCYWLLQNVLVDDKTKKVPLADNMKNVNWKIQSGQYSSLTHSEKLLYLLTQIQQRINQMPSVISDVRLNVSDMSYLVGCVYQTEQKMEMPRRNAIG